MTIISDVRKSGDDLHGIWELGLRDDAMSNEMVVRANIKEITERIIARQEGFMVRLSGVLLFGVTRLYSKKSIIFLFECQEALAKISLKPPENIEKDGNKRKERKNKDQDNQIEIDEETLKIWNEKENIENIIEQEKNNDSHFERTELDIEQNASQRRLNISNQRSDIFVGNIDNNFDNVPFVIDDMNMQNGELSDNDNIISFANYKVIDNADNNNEQDFNYIEQDLMNALKKSGKNRKFQIDISPIIPMAQVSMLLEDASATLCKRPKIEYIKHSCLDASPFDLDDLLDEVKKITSQNKNRDLVNIQPIEEYENLGEVNQEFQEQQNTSMQPFESDSIDKEMSVLDKEETQQFSDDLLPKLNREFKKKKEVNLIEVVPDKSKRTIAISFFTALSLKTRRVVDLIQRSDSEIGIIKGTKFNYNERK